MLLTSKLEMSKSLVPLAALTLMSPSLDLGAAWGLCMDLEGRACMGMEESGSNLFRRLGTQVSEKEA